MTPFIKVVEEIIAAAGQTERFKTDEHYHVKIPNEPYMALVIESWEDHSAPFVSRHISVAHYYEQNGDLVPDPEVEIFDSGFPIELSQAMLFTPVVIGYGKTGPIVNHGAKIEVRAFLDMWAENLRDQGFVEAARKLMRKGENNGG